MTVGPGGDLAIPALPPDEEALLLRRTPNLHARRASAAHQGRVVVVRTRPSHVEIVREQPSSRT